MTRRLEQVVLLLRSLGDWRFEPETSTGAMVRRSSQPGSGPTTRSSCQACQGEGWVRRRGIRYGCVHCGGNEDFPADNQWTAWTGDRRADVLIGKLGRGWIHTDAYTETKVGSYETEHSSEQALVHCDACGGSGAFGNGRRCERCDGGGKLPVHRDVLRYRGVTVTIETSEPLRDPLLSSMERRESVGSYAELSRALDWLRSFDVLAYRLVDQVYVHPAREPEDLNPMLRHRLEIGLHTISLRLPDELRVPASAYAIERRRQESAA